MLRDLPERWRERADELRPYSPSAAEAFCRAALELEGEIRQLDRDELTLSEASKASGYSIRRLRELAAAGELENVGRRGAPRFRRADLPRKPGRSTADPANESILKRMKALQ